jgi:hypothetical protein
LNTSGVGTIFVYVSDSSMPLQDQVIITSSDFNVDLTGKLDLTGPKDNLPGNPNNDVISVNGVFNLPNVDLSSLSGRQVRCVLNGVDPIFTGTLDANGHATQGDASTGRTGNFSVSLPSGNFHVDAKGNFMSSLGLPDLSFMQNNANLNFKNQNKTNARQMACTFEFFIDGLFPTAPLPPPMIEYVVSSRFIDKNLAQSSTNSQASNNTSTNNNTSTTTVGSTNLQPPHGAIGGNTVGVYRLGGKFQNIGKHTHVPVQGASNSGNSAQKIPNNIGSVAGTEFFISGGFMVTAATMNLVGNDVFADISGVLAPPGGGQIVFDPDTDIAISLGGAPYTEVLNPSTTPGFKASKNVLSFKRSSSLGKTGIASFALAESGTSFFRLKSFALPNEQVQIDPTQGKQTMYFSIIVTPADTGAQTLVNRYPVTGITHFSLQKAAKTGKQQGDLFVH